DLTDASKLQVAICDVQGHVAYGGHASGGTATLEEGDPIGFAEVTGFDASVPPDAWSCADSGQCNPRADAGSSGAFGSLSIPVLDGIRLEASFLEEDPSNRRINLYSGTTLVDHCPAATEPAEILADYDRLAYLFFTLYENDGHPVADCEAINGFLFCSS